MILPVPYYSQHEKDSNGNQVLEYPLRDIRLSDNSPPELPFLHNKEIIRELTSEYICNTTKQRILNSNDERNQSILGKDIWPDIPYTWDNVIFSPNQPWRLKIYLGACNITSLAMILDYLGYFVPARGGPGKIVQDIFANGFWSQYKSMARARNVSTEKTTADYGNKICQQFRIIENINNLDTFARVLYNAESRAGHNLGATSKDDFINKIREILHQGLPILFQNGLYNTCRNKGIVETGHYAIIIGIDDEEDGYVYVNDPYGRSENLVYKEINPEITDENRCELFSKIPINDFKKVIPINPRILIINKKNPDSAPPESEPAEEEEPVMIHLESKGDEIEHIHSRIQDSEKIYLYKILPALPDVTFSDAKFQELVSHYRENITDKEHRCIRPLTQGFGYTPKKHWYTCGYHMGIDLHVELKTPIRAAHPGKVSKKNEESRNGEAYGYGSFIAIRNEEMLIETRYGHLSHDRMFVDEGDDIYTGQVIGESGNTGYSSGPHLHFEIRKLKKVKKDGKDVLEEDVFFPIPGNDFIGLGKFINPLGSLVEWYYTIIQVVFPMENAMIKSPLYYFYKAEVAREGYYPFGLSRTLHGGIHIFSDAYYERIGDLGSDTAMFEETVSTGMIPVTAIAPGYIIAARFASEHTKLEETDPENDIFRKFVNNYSGFVLIRHDITIKEEEDDVPLYSLYMHLAPLSLPGDEIYDTAADYWKVGWIRRIVKLRKQRLLKIKPKDKMTAAELFDTYYLTDHITSFDNHFQFRCIGKEDIFSLDAPVRTPDDKTEYRRTAFLKEPPEDAGEAISELPFGTLMTFTEAFIPVSLGETIGFIKGEKGISRGYLHWELFSLKGTDTLDKLISALGDLDIDSGIFKTFSDKDNNDNYLQKKELEKMLNDYSSLDASQAEKDNSEALEMLTQTLPSDNLNLDNFMIGNYRNKLIHLFTDQDFTYRITLKVDNERIDSYFDEHHVYINFYKYILVNGIKGRELLLNETVPFTIGELKAGKEVTIPLEAELIEASCVIGNVYIEVCGKQADLFNQIVNQRLRNIRLVHTSEWTQQAMDNLLNTLKEKKYLDSHYIEEGVEKKDESDQATIDRHFKALYPLVWWDRPLKDDTNIKNEADPFGEVPIVGNEDSEKSLFSDDFLGTEGDVEHLHPVTTLWMLQLLTSVNKIRFKERWDQVENDGSNPVIDFAWVFPSRFADSMLTLLPNFGQEGFLLAIGENYRKGDESDISIFNPGIGKSLKVTKLLYNTDGICIHPIAPCLWGVWRLPNIDNENTNKDLIQIQVNKPQLLGFPVYMLIEETVKNENEEEEKREFLTIYLQFRGDTGSVPECMEGFLFFQIHQYTESPAEEGEESPAANSEATPEPGETNEKTIQWETLDNAFPVKAKRVRDGDSFIVIKCDLTEFRQEHFPAEQDENQFIDVRIAFFCPNGGFLCYKDEIIPEKINTEPIEKTFESFINDTKIEKNGSAYYDLLCCGNTGIDTWDPDKDFIPLIIKNKPTGVYYTPNCNDLHYFSDNNNAKGSLQSGYLKNGDLLRKLTGETVSGSYKYYQMFWEGHGIIWCASAFLTLLYNNAYVEEELYTSTIDCLRNFKDVNDNFSFSNEYAQRLTTNHRFKKLKEREYLYNIEGFTTKIWYKIEKENGDIAWCFSGYVRKI
ncbi:MAG: peptidoglycan DD-metalloendopeptidase family protein [Spirochaetales bacterium]|nr:peptidoglycan DD-metalloendopeptidase family protein [Spirochaetales bacterium]